MVEHGDDDDAVGYGKPPKRHQFLPGQSGNLRGRPRGSRGLKTDLDAELSEQVTITQEGKQKKISKQQVILKALASKAANGHMGAAALIIPLTIQMFGFEDRRAQRKQLSPQDQAILDAMLDAAQEPRPVTDDPSLGQTEENNEPRS